MLGDYFAKEAVTRFRVLERRAGLTFVELFPKTGRMHQLRLQASSRGFPVLGDALYGSVGTFGPASELAREKWIALHAKRLTVEHPFRKVALVLESAVPENWQKAELGM